MKPSRNITLFIAALTVACFLLIAGTSINQSAVAGPVSNQLKPPFKFQKTSTVNTNDLGFPSPGSSSIFTETFGASFAPTTTLGITPAWRVITNTGASNYYWGGVTSGGFAPSAWPAAAQIAPGVGITYPANLDTWLVYGPLDLSHYASAYLSFNYYLDSTPGACYPTYSGDCLSWAYSFDGVNFTGSDTSGHISPALGGSQWLTGSLVLNNINFKTSTLYLAFAFNSGNLPSGVGAFIRNVAVVGNPLKYSYLPVAMNNYAPSPTPTATPIPPLYGYTFDEADPTGTGSDLSKWGGQFYDGTRSGGGGPYAYSQNVRIGHGNPGNSLLLYTTASYLIAAGSPNNHAPVNFDLYVDTSPWRLYPSDDYGIIFGADDGTIGSNPGAFNGNGNFYFLYVGTSDVSVQPKGIRLDICSGGNCSYISGNAGNNGFVALPSSFVGNASAWDTLHVQRNGSLINIWVNSQLVISVNDTTYTGARKWGTAIIAFSNDPTYPPVGGQMEVDFDNIKMYSLP